MALRTLKVVVVVVSLVLTSCASTDVSSAYVKGYSVDNLQRIAVDVQANGKFQDGADGVEIHASSCRVESERVLLLLSDEHGHGVMFRMPSSFHDRRPVDVTSTVTSLDAVDSLRQRLAAGIRAKDALLTLTKSGSFEVHAWGVDKASNPDQSDELVFGFTTIAFR
jgi:hypothetical protein